MVVVEEGVVLGGEGIAEEERGGEGKEEKGR